MATNKNTNGFPTNGGFPKWLGKKTCNHCGNILNFSEYEELGFYLKGKNKGKLFVNFYCSKCEEYGTLNFGQEDFTIERLCTFVIQHSKVMKVAEKELWNRKYSEENE